MRRTLTLAAALTALTAAALAPAQAITGGEPDDAHPYVGLVVAFGAGDVPPSVCSGAFLDADTFVTAGHCFDDETTSVEVRLGEGPLDSSVPTVGEVASVQQHPRYDAADFSAHDVAVVELVEPLAAEVLAEFAELPEQDALDALTPSVRTIFDVVGYGWTQASTPEAGRQVSTFERMVAHPRLLKINHKETGEGSFVVSANSKTGGTCFGDSGGPVLLPGTDVVTGVVSYGKNALCGGQSGVYRIDREDDLEFLSGYLN